MFSDEHFDDLLMRLEELAADAPESTVSDLVRRDVSLTAEVQRDPEILDRLRGGFRTLRQANRRLGLDVQDEPVPSIPGFNDFREMGRGGMGVVYRAYQPSLRRNVAIKLMLAGRMGGPALRARFRIEAEAVARLKHPNIIEVYEVGEVDSIPYTSFEYLGGGSLSAHIARHPLGEREATHVVKTLAVAMEYAHRQGIIHRDLKPSNIRATAEGVWKITDFGIAKDLHNGHQLTRTDEIAGSPSYMSPEQIDGEEITPATDVYAMGAILYECLTGRPPFLGETSAETIRQVSAEDPVQPTSFRPGIARDLEAICLKCLEKKPQNRYNSARELTDDLQRWLDGRTTIAQPAPPLRRVVKFVRRRPLVALTLATLSLAILAIAITGWWYSLLMRQSYRREHDARMEATASREAAEQYAHEANQERQRSAELLYWTTVWKTHEAWKADDVNSFLALYTDLADSHEFGDNNKSFPLRHLSTLRDAGRSTLLNKSPNVFAVKYCEPRRVLTGDESGTLKLWDLNQRSPLRELKQHASCINSLDRSPDGNLLASASCDATIGIWSLPDLNLKQRLQSPHGPIGTVRFSADGTRLISVGMDHNISTWDLKKGQIVDEIVKQDGNLVHAVVNRNGTWAASATAHGRISWWNLDRPSQFLLKDTLSSILNLMFNHSGTKLLATCRGGRNWMWNVEDNDVGEPIVTISDWGLASFSSDDRIMAVACSDQVVRLFEVDARQVVGSFKIPNEKIRDLSFSAENDLLLAVTDSGKIIAWEIAASRDYKRCDVSIRSATTIRLSPDASRMAIAHDDGSITVRDIPEPTGTTQLSTSSEHRIESLNFSSDGSLLISMAQGNLLRVWDLSGENAELILEEFQTGLQDISGTTGLRVQHSRNQSSLAVLDLQSSAVRNHLEGIGQRVLSRFGTAGSRLFMGVDNRFFLWQPDTGLEVELPRPVAGHPIHCEFSRDDSACAVVVGREVVVYSVAEGSVRAVLKGHRGKIDSLVFFPDGRFLATGGPDQVIRIWHIDTGQLSMELEGHEMPICSLRFAPDGSGLFSLGHSGLQGELLFWPAALD